MKSSWIGIGFSHQRVPSLSNVAMRSDGGTKFGPSSVTERTKSRIASLLLPSFQLPSTSSFAIFAAHLSRRPTVDDRRDPYLSPAIRWPSPDASVHPR